MTPGHDKLSTREIRCKDFVRKCIKQPSGMPTAPVDNNLAGFPQLGVFTCHEICFQALPAVNIYTGSQHLQWNYISKVEKS